MENMKYKIISLAFLILLIFFVSDAAAESGVIILVSDNSADCGVAETLAEENNATILKTAWGVFEQDVLDTILDAGPSEVIIVGGPRAVVEEYENQLRGAGIIVTRHWGRTRQQTSLAVFNAFRMRFNWSSAVGDGAQPYRMGRRFPIWFYDNETEIDSFLMQRRGAMVLNYGRNRRFAGRHGGRMRNVTQAQVDNYGRHLRNRIHGQYGNTTWQCQRLYRGQWLRQGEGRGLGRCMMGGGMGSGGY
jgi:hypothetical protein